MKVLKNQPVQTIVYQEISIRKFVYIFVVVIIAVTKKNDNVIATLLSRCKNTLS